MDENGVRFIAKRRKMQIVIEKKRSRTDYELVERRYSRRYDRPYYHYHADQTYWYLRDDVHEWFCAHKIDYQITFYDKWIVQVSDNDEIAMLVKLRWEVS